MAQLIQDLPPSLPYQVGPTITRRPFLEGVQSLDPYPVNYTRTFKDRASTYQPRLAVRTSWTNLLSYSSTLQNAAWTKTNLTATDGVAAHPRDGLATLATLMETTANAAHTLGRNHTFAAAYSHCLDVVAKANGRDWIRLLAHDGTQDYEGWFNLATGATKPFADVINDTTLNGGMETAGAPLGSWTAFTTGTGAVTRDTAIFRTGTASAKLAANGPGNIAGIQQSVQQVGRRARLGFWARTATGTLNVLAGLDALSAATTFAVTPSWTYCELTATAGTAEFQVWSEAVGDIYIDDLTLTPLEPVPLLHPGLLNGSFETAGGGGADPFADWTEGTLGTSAITRETGTKRIGAASCKFVIDASGSLAYVRRIGLLEIGRRYRIGFWAQGTGTVVVSTDGSIANLTQPLVAGTWTYHSVEVIATGNDVWLSSTSASTELYFDDVAVTPLDLPELTMTLLPWPAAAVYRCSLVFQPRAAAGSVTLALSSDGTTLSYTGETAKGIYAASGALYPAASTPGPIVETLGSTRTVSAPDIDASDPFAYLVAESEPTPVAGDLLRVERTYARLPAQQLTRDYQSFSRPNCSGLRSGGTYGANVDGDESFRLWTSRKSVLGYQTTAGGTTSNTLPSSNVTITLSDASFVTQPANASQATWQAAVNSAIVGGGKLSACIVAKTDSVLTFWIYNSVGGATVSSVSNPSGTTLEQTGSMIRLTAFGTSITPDTKLVHCPSHGAAVGERVALWNGHALVATGSVAGVSDANYLSIVLSDLNSPDFNFTHLTLGDDAAFRYASGAREINIRTARDFWLPGVTMLSDGTTLSTLDSLPAVSTYQSAQAWLDRIVAADTYTAINASQLAAYLGPIQWRDTVYAKKDATCLESLTLT